jgi:hypothetical protein
MRPGKTIEFAGGEITLHPLSLTQVQELAADIIALQAISRENVLSVEANGRLARVLTASASRAHPSLTADEILTMIDMEDVVCGRVSQAVRTVMGMTPFTSDTTAGERTSDAAAAGD